LGEEEEEVEFEVVLLFEGLVHEGCLLAIWNQRFATHFGKEDFSAAAKPVEISLQSYYSPFPCCFDPVVFYGMRVPSFLGFPEWVHRFGFCQIR
jgi:hypothetical protein